MSDGIPPSQARVLVLSSSTGGGHDTRARAFQAWAHELTDWEVRIHQALEETSPVYRFGVGLYNWIQRTWPVLHHVYFNYLELVSMVREPGRILGSDRFRALLGEYRPDIVLSTHDHLNHGFFALARQVLGEGVRCVTYCGELHGGYGFSRHWVNPSADLFIAAVEETAETAVSMGMPPERVRTGGFLLDPAFYARPLRPAQREQIVAGELGLDPSRPVLLLATGAAGANNHLRLLDRLERDGRPRQAVALCGRDESALRAVSEAGKGYRHVTVRALPYQRRMAELLQCASAVVTRPGTGTTSEAILAGCPLIFNGIGGIMPQEMITVRFAEKHGIGLLVRNPAQLVDALGRLERDPHALAALAERVRGVRPRGHPRDILRWCANA